MSCISYLNVLGLTLPKNQSLTIMIIFNNKKGKEEGSWKIFDVSFNSWWIWLILIDKKGNINFFSMHFVLHIKKIVIISNLYSC